jgi:hypothetical protein
VRGSGLLDAYRKSSGLLLREIRTQVARERLALMGDRCRAEYSAGQHNNLLIAKEIAARHARLAWTGFCRESRICHSSGVSAYLFDAGSE